MTQETDRLRDLVKVVNTASEFYEKVRQRVDDAELRAFCEANLADKQRVLDKLQALVVAKTGQEEEGTDLSTRVEEHRAELVAALNANDVYVYLDHLEDLENRTQGAVEEALAAAESPGLNDVLRELKPLFDQMHDRMRAAQQKATGREVPKTIPTRIMRQERQER